MVLFPGWVGQSAPAHDDEAGVCVGTSVEMIGHTSRSRQLKIFDVASSGEVSTANIFKYLCVVLYDFIFIIKVY